MDLSLFQERSLFTASLHSHRACVAVNIDSVGKTATALPECNHAYTEVAHMIALMMDCTCHLLHDRKIQTVGEELRKAFTSKHDEEEGGGEGEGADTWDTEGGSSTGKGPPPTSQSVVQKGSAKKGAKDKSDSVSASSFPCGGAVNYYYSVTDENLLTHNLHYGQLRGDQSGRADLFALTSR